MTGGAGFIGSHLVDLLLATTRADVSVLDDFSRGREGNLARHAGHPRLNVVRGDVRDCVCVREALRGADVVFHLAGQETCGDGLDVSSASFDVNVGGTLMVLRTARDLALRRVLVTSCWEVYGEPLDLPVCEDHPLLPLTSCGASKAASEAYCCSFRHARGPSIVVLRLGEVYGPRDRAGPIATWIERAVAGLDLVANPGAAMRDIIWVGDVVSALVRAAALDQRLPPINVAAGTGTRPLDAARRIARLAGHPGQVVLLPVAPTPVARFVASVDRMRHFLAVEPPLDPLAHLPELVDAARHGLGAVDSPVQVSRRSPSGRWARGQAAAML